MKGQRDVIDVPVPAVRLADCAVVLIFFFRASAHRQSVSLDSLHRRRVELDS